MPSYSYTPEDVTISTLCVSVGAAFPGNFVSANILSRPPPQMLYIAFNVALTVGEQTTLNVLVAANKASYVPPVPSSPPGVMVFMGGASMGSGDVGKFFGAQDTSNGLKNAVLSSDNQMSCGQNGYLSALSWNSVSANATTVFKVFKNGLSVETITLTGVKGVASLSTPVVRGDLISVEFDAGLAPGRTTVQVYVTQE